MDMNMLQGMVQQQKLILTTEMQQSLKILQMTNLELNENILNELQENPLIEIASEEIKLEDNEKLEENQEFKEIDYKEIIKDREFNDYDSINYNYENEEKVDALNFVQEKGTLKSYLFEQALYLEEEDNIKCICDYIIENIDTRGYLNCRIDEIAEDLGEEIATIEYALSLIQKFQPYGVGARNINECLKIQLEMKGIKDSEIYVMVEKQLELIADNKLKEISKLLNISIEKVQQYCNIIKKLEPKPSRGFNTNNIDNYVIPEAYIRKIGKDLYVVMNDKAVPRLIINNFYKDVIKKQGNDDISEYIKNKLNSAAYLIKGIEQRNRTIYNVLEKIVEVQKDYFIFGEQHLKPMTIKEISEELGIHESTVSRAIRDKYISTTFNTVRIKDLFTNKIESNLDGDISSNVVKKEIKEIINKEDKAKPISDQDISDILKELKINISRRTVAKYREEIGIAASSKRKVFKEK